jgi:hypothetical protein
MDATDQLAEDTSRVLERWLADRPRTGLTSRHVDELIPGAEKESWVEFALALLVRVCMHPMEGTRLVIGCFPLEPSEGLMVTVPDWREVTLNGTEEPPSIYVMDLRAYATPESVEEFRFPMNVPWRPPDGLAFAAYYRCFRPALGLENNWEYERAVYIEVLVPSNA